MEQGVLRGAGGGRGPTILGVELEMVVDEGLRRLALHIRHGGGHGGLRLRRGRERR